MNSFDMDSFIILVSIGYVHKKQNPRQKIRMKGEIIYVDIGERRRQKILPETD